MRDSIADRVAAKLDNAKRPTAADARAAVDHVQKKEHDALKGRANPSTNGHASTIPDDEIVFQTFSDLKAKPVKWEIPGRFPLGKLVMVAGDGGQGKSTLIRHVIARVTTGRPGFGMHYDPLPPGRVVLFAHEDGAEDVILPSLIAEGADVSRVVRVPYVETTIGKEKAKIHFGLGHIELLKRKLTESGDIRLVVIDPIASFIGRCRIDDHKQSELRRALDPLSELAEATGACVILIAHVNKSNGGQAVHRIAGSATYSNTVRLAHIVITDPDDTERRLLMPVKPNLLGAERDSLAFRLVKLSTDQASAHRDHAAFSELSQDDFALVAGEMARLEFDGNVTVNANEVMASQQQQRTNRRGNRQQCQDWLVTFLAHYAYPSAEIFAAGSEAGFSRGLVYAAREAFNEVRPREDQIRASNQGFQGAWWWGMGNPSEWTRRPEVGSGQPDTGDAIADDLANEIPP